MPKNITQKYSSVWLFFAHQAYGVNLFQNPNFETGNLDLWINTCTSSFGTCSVPEEFTHSVTAGKNGSSFVYKSELSNSANGTNGYTNNIHQAIDTVVGDQKYIISYDAKPVNTKIPTGITLWFYEDNGSGGNQFISSATTNFDVIEPNTNNWKNYRTVFTTPPTAQRVRVLMHHYVFGGAPFSGNIYRDNFLFERCEDYNADPYNLVIEGDFENGNLGGEWSTYWCSDVNSCQIIGNDSTPNGYCGNRSAKIDLATNGATKARSSLLQSIGNIFPEERYTLSFSAISNNTDHFSGMSIASYDDNNGTSTYLGEVNFEPVAPNSGKWQDYTTEIITPPGTDFFRLWMRSFNKDDTTIYQGDVQWDNIRVIAHPRIDNIQPGTSDTVINGGNFGATDQDSIVFVNHQKLNENQYIWGGDNQLTINFPLTNTDSVQVVRSGYYSITKTMLQGVYSLDGSDINALSFDFDITRGFAIKSLRTPGTSQEYVLNKQTLLSSLYELDIKQSPFSDKVTTLDTRKMDDYVISQVDNPGEKTLTLTTYHNDEEIIITSIITLTENGAKFEIDVQNNGELVVQSVRYPIIVTKPGIGSDTTKDEVLIPYNEGYILKDPRNYIFGINKNTKLPKTSLTKYSNRDRPGPMSAQLLAFYNRALPNDGLYMQSTEHLGYKQRFGVKLSADETGQRSMEFAFRHVSAESGGNDITIMEDRLDGARNYRDYAVIIDDLQARDTELSWYDAADRYKIWAAQQVWAVPLAQRTDIPDWIFDVKALVNIYRVRNDCFTQWNAFWRDRLELSSSDLTLLNPGGYWGVRSNTATSDYSGTCNTGYVLDGDNSWSGIDYFAGSGPDPLATAINNLTDNNTKINLMIEGLRWDVYDFILANNENNADSTFCKTPYYSLTDDAINTLPLPGDSTGLSEIGAFVDIAIPLDDRPDFTSLGRQFISKNEDSSGYFAINTGIADHRNSLGTPPRTQNCRYSAFMCMGNDNSNPLDLILIDNIAKGINRGVRMFGLDGWIGADIEGCWNNPNVDPTHPAHDIGEGRWTHLRYLNFLQDIENKATELGARNEVIITSENQTELYVHLAEMQHSRHDDLSQALADKKVGLFSYIYKKYSIGYDRGPSMPDDWDDDFNDGASPQDADKQLYNRWGIGMNFVNANIFGVISSSHWGRLTKQITSDPEYLFFKEKYFGLFKRVVHTHSPEIHRGEILRPDIYKWTGNAPKDFNITVGNREFNIDPVLSNIIKTDASQISYLFVNINRDEPDASVNSYELDLSFINASNILAKGVGLAGDYYKVTITRRGADLGSVKFPEIKKFIIGNSTPPATKILKGGDVLEIHIEATSDIDGDGINNIADPDNDNDGILDINETGSGIFISPLDTGSNPLVSDSDNDGVNDGLEVEAGTNPNSAAEFPILSNGDVNNDGVVDTADLVIAVRIILKKENPTPLQIAKLDVAPLVAGIPAPDGKITTGDYLVLMQKALGIINY